MFVSNFDIAAVTYFANNHTGDVVLATEQAEAIQYATLRGIVDGAEVYEGGKQIQAVYDWNNDGKWILSESYHKTHVYDVQVADIEQEINSGLFYLAEPEQTAFHLKCGFIIEHDANDWHPYVLHGRNGGEIDRWPDVRELAETVVDTLAEEAEEG